MRQEQSLFIEIVHELQTPLAVILGNLEVVEHGDAREKKRAMRVIRGTLSGMSRMINEVLGNARGEIYSGGGGAALIGVNDLLEEIKDDCIILAANRNITLTILDENPPGAHRASISIDKYKIKEVILNLINNALRHTDPGGTIYLKNKIVPVQEKIFAAISVEDTGAGIPEEYLEHIFERFYRIAGNDGQGTGLGLSICRKIIEEHGGSIGVWSVPGRGSCFTIRIPAAPERL